MEKIKALLVDDEASSRIVLKELLKKHAPSIEIVGEASIVEEAYREILAKNPDLVFLDIQMPTGNGFNLLEKFTTIPFDIIFVTSYNQYAINAIKFNALDYILKPIDVSELKKAIQKAEERKSQNENNQVKMLNLIDTMSEKTGMNKKIPVHDKDKVKLLEVLDIKYIIADVNYSIMHTVKNETFSLSKSLKEFEEYLEGNNNFVRAHKGFILNIKFVKEYTKNDPCVVTMTDGKEFEISRRKKQELLDALKSLK